MSLTKNGLRTGAAGAADLREFRADLFDKQVQEARRRHRFAIQWRWTVRQLERLLKDGFDAWWDSYPAEMSKKDFLPIMMTKAQENNRGKNDRQ